ncbi:MAG: hypothetical protein GX625_00070 [Clostridiaceae bacterium]|nr:hypothetical protein [Clostridiaceae bacterium]
MNMYLDHAREPELYKQAEEILKQGNFSKITVSLFQRRLQIGYMRAFNLVEDLLENKQIKPTGAQGVYKISKY